MKPTTVCIFRSFTFSYLSQDFAWKICWNRWRYELVWQWFPECWTLLNQGQAEVCITVYILLMKQAIRLQPDPQNLPPLICAEYVVFIIFSWAERTWRGVFCNWRLPSFCTQRHAARLFSLQTPAELQCAKLRIHYKIEILHCVVGGSVYRLTQGLQTYCGYLLQDLDASSLIIMRRPDCRVARAPKSAI